MKRLFLLFALSLSLSISPAYADSIAGHQTGQSVPTPYSWTFADATARASTTNPNTSVAYTSFDVNKTCFQTSTGEVFKLTSITPTWLKVGGPDSAISGAPPTGSAGGDLAGTYPNPTLKSTGTAGTYADASHTPVITTDAQGRVTAVTSTTIAIAGSQVASGTVGTARLGSGSATISTYLRGDQSWAAVPAGGATGAEIRMGSVAYSLTTTYGVVQSAGQAPFQINLPSAGTYRVFAIVPISGGATANDDIRCELYDATNTVVVTNSEVSLGNLAASTAHEIVISRFITTAGSVNIQLWAKNFTAARGTVPALTATFGYIAISSGASYPLPAITSFSPTSGPVGTSVVITGTGFTGATANQFNGVTASYSVGADTTITATVPTTTTGAITVTTAGGTATSSSNYVVGSAAIAQNGSTVIATGSGTSYTCSGCSWSSGDTVFCAVDIDNDNNNVTATSVVGGTGLSWAKVTDGTQQAVIGSSSDILRLELWYAVAPSSQSGQTITTTLSSSPPRGSNAAVFVLSNVASFNKVAVNRSTFITSPIAISSLTTTTATTTLLIFGAYGNIGGAGNVSQPSGYTDMGTSGATWTSGQTAMGLGLQTVSNTSTGTYSPGSMTYGGGGYTAGITVALH